MNREEIEQRAFQYRLEWNNDLNDRRSSVDVMTDFAILITEAEDKAWNASRETVVLPYNENPVLEEDYETWKYKYQSPNDWRKETNNG